MRNIETGSSLVETGVALAILGMVGTVFLGGLLTTTKTNFTSDQFGTAASLAQLQTESIKAAPYSTNATQYSAAPIPEGKDYTGYSVRVTASPLHNTDDGIQRITVNIDRNGRQVFSLESFKVER